MPRTGHFVQRHQRALAHDRCGVPNALDDDARERGNVALNVVARAFDRHLAWRIRVRALVLGKARAVGSCVCQWGRARRRARTDNAIIAALRALLSALWLIRCTCASSVGMVASGGSQLMSLSSVWFSLV